MKKNMNKRTTRLLQAKLNLKHAERNDADSFDFGEAMKSAGGPHFTSMTRFIMDRINGTIDEDLSADIHSIF